MLFSSWIGAMHGNVFNSCSVFSTPVFPQFIYIFVLLSYLVKLEGLTVTWILIFLFHSQLFPHSVSAYELARLLPTGDTNHVRSSNHRVRLLRGSRE